MKREIDELFLCLTGYWGERIATQLKIAQEIVEIDASLEKDLERAVAFIKGQYRAQKCITEADVKQAEEYLSLIGKRAKEYEVLLAAHAHIDMNWMWGHDETVALTVATMRTMLTLLREYPDFCFSQSQASVYSIIEEYAPDLLPEIRERIREGRWEVTASTWVEGDKNLANGETLIRQYTLTRAYLKRLLDLTDGDFDLDFQPDTFGHNKNMPSIMQACGVKYYYHCRGRKTPSVYRWVDESGAEVLSYRNDYWYGGVIDYKTFIGNVTAMRGQGLSVLLRLYGVGDHGGGASRRDINRIHDMAGWTVMPRLTLSTIREYYRRLEGVRDTLPVFKGEVNPVFTGCYTSQSEIKKSNAMGERLLFRAESSAALVRSLSLKLPRVNNLDNAWKRQLFNHFHDILPGSCVFETRCYALGEAQQRDALINNAFTENMRVIAANVNCKGFVLDLEEIGNEMGAGGGYNVKEGFGFSEGEGLSRAYLVYNSSAVERDFVFEIPLWEYSGSVDYLSVTDGEGNDLPFEILDREQKVIMGYNCRRIAVQCHLKALSYKTVYFHRGEDKKAICGGGVLDTFVQFEYWPYVLENCAIKATFNAKGDLVTLLDKATGRTCGSEEKPLASFLSVIENVSEGMSSWKLGPYIKESKLSNVICPHIRQKPQGLVKEYVFTAQFGERSSLQVSYKLMGDYSHLKVAATVDFLEVASSEEAEPGTVARPEKTVSSLVYRLLVGDEQFISDVPFGTITRPAENDDRVATRGVLSEKNGVFLCSEGKHGYRGTESYMQVNLLRATGVPDAYPEVGKHTFNVYVGFTSFTGERLVGELNALEGPVSVFNFRPTNGTLPESASLLELHGGAAISSVKPSVDGSGIILRLYTCGNGGRQAICFPRLVCRAFVCDGHESVLDELCVNGDTVYLTLSSHEIKTVKICFEEEKNNEN